MNFSEIKVSVITPVYNVEEYLRETLDSLVNQTCKEIEIIMVDDGSTDSSPEIIEEYAKKYSNVVFIRQENSGPGAARNNGLDNARGEFISFVDSDDILPEDALETMYEAAIEEGADVVTGASLSFNSKESWYIASHLNNGVYRPGEKALISNPELLYSLGPCNKLYRRSIVQDIRFPLDIKVTEDQPFVIEAYLRAKKMYTVDKIIYNYRQRETETNISLSQIVKVDSVAVLSDIFKSLKLSDQLWDKYIQNKVSRNAIKTSYYMRIAQADIWPAIRSAIDSKECDVQVKTFSMLLEWVKEMDRYVFNGIPILHRVMTYEIAERFNKVCEKAKDIYLQWLITAFALMDPTAIHVLDISSRKKIFNVTKKAAKRRSLTPIYYFLFKRKMKKYYTLARMATARRIVLPLSGFLPQQKKITFATNKFPAMSDSFQEIYKQLIDLRPDYEIKGYLKKKKNFKDFCRMYHDMATSKYVILDDYYRHLYKLKLPKRTEVIQTWHAAGAFKKFGHSSIGYADSNTVEFENQAHRSYTKAVVTCQEIVPLYAEAFKMPEKNIYPLGLPRTDIFFNEDAKQYIRNKYYGMYENLRGKKVITYAPTFRGGPGKRANFHLELELVDMARELGDEYVLVLKMHPSVTKNTKIPSEAKEFVINMSQHDISEVMIMTDVLISDYSSLVFEYALLERPMIFFAYDLENYLEERGFYYEYEDFVPGPITSNTDEIINLIKSGDFDLEKVRAFAERFFDHRDGQAAKRFVETLIKP
ncbi:bifunctional glycosyltransferase/CDP-glycerol:glycerophosphate glycerophosphotransferase [Bacillus sp. EB01]|uniref:bifunctional glycosyltransferase/CDP-glycerol:glycerophosphate glycerophosphotransferase n=1 Tax=Bacillus sp. EB01 TaxID=1347086 RepID=UPI0005C6790F|nr:CDP-glycerol glycerophosphotransferase family protein [Bacillus sp. EB01]